MAQPQRLVHALVVELERQHGGSRQHLHLLDSNLDLTGCELGVHVLGVAGAHRSFDLDHELVSQRVRFRQTVGAQHQLHLATGVTQVDEHEAAVVAPPRHPSRQRHLRTDVVGPQLAAKMCSIAHESSLTRSSSATWRCSPDTISRTVATPAAHSSSPTTTVGGRASLGGILELTAEGAAAEHGVCRHTAESRLVHQRQHPRPGGVVRHHKTHPVARDGLRRGELEQRAPGPTRTPPRESAARQAPRPARRSGRRRRSRPVHPARW